MEKLRLPGFTAALSMDDSINVYREKYCYTISRNVVPTYLCNVGGSPKWGPGPMCVCFDDADCSSMPLVACESRAMKCAPPGTVYPDFIVNGMHVKCYCKCTQKELGLCAQGPT